MGVRTPETCWAVHTSKRQVINLRNCCIWLVDLLKCVMMNRPANFKFKFKKNTYLWDETQHPIRCTGRKAKVFSSVWHRLFSSRTVQQNSCSSVMRSVSCKTIARERRWVAPTAIVSAPDAAGSRAHNKEEQIFRVCAGTEHEQTQPAERSHIQPRKQQAFNTLRTGDADLRF